MRRLVLPALVVLSAGVVVYPASSGEEWSTPVATGAATPGGAPLPWKNRDNGPPVEQGRFRARRENRGP